jgi:hypothetical protein
MRLLTIARTIVRVPSRRVRLYHRHPGELREQRQSLRLEAEWAGQFKVDVDANGMGLEMSRCGGESNTVSRAARCREDGTRGKASCGVMF